MSPLMNCIEKLFKMNDLNKSLEWCPWIPVVRKCVAKRNAKRRERSTSDAHRLYSHTLLWCAFVAIFVAEIFKRSLHLFFSHSMGALRCNARLAFAFIRTHQSRLARAALFGTHSAQHTQTHINSQLANICSESSAQYVSAHWLTI